MSNKTHGTAQNTESAPIRLLLVEDSSGDARLISEILKDAPAVTFELTTAKSVADTAGIIETSHFDVLLLDLGLPDSKGLDTINRAKRIAPRLPIVVLTGADDEAQAMEAVRRGAQDYLIKGQVDQRLMVRAIRYSIERKRIEEELKEFNERLEQRVAERTAIAEQRARQLRALAIELTRTEQRERRRLAEILHDHLQQILIAAKYGIGAMRHRTQNEESLQSAMKNVDNLIDEAIKASRSLTSELSPPVVYEGSLVAAIEWLGRWMNDRHGLKVAVVARPEVRPVDLNTRVLLFGAVRELLLNIHKHAEVDEAGIEIFRHQNNATAIRVSDKGVGFEKSLIGPGESEKFGLFSIKERFETMGGRLLIESAPGKGSTITVIVPDPAPKPTVSRASKNLTALKDL